ncbi:hypothetical protein LSTR_LSTR012786 [Laodelphax striatellus]|uniref:CAP-Gly domain-containing protein n=1 Tax=Laodelphax striatellus TaxID=195883 RepID=A0A482XSS8_LAOST|nr:hypothetical protein LSTR_LSTR012786 [Laodelphax striatellus]
MLSLPLALIEGSDSLWADLRRLSEAGVRRGSDSSIVLTEDTDSFIIGEHVWVGGTKPGQIAYIGETQFAPGDWAGIVLDDPIDFEQKSLRYQDIPEITLCKYWSHRYFDCLPNFGLFAPLHKVSKSPSGGRKSVSSAAGCVMHPAGKKHGSRESLNSIATNASSVKSSASRVRLGVTSLSRAGPNLTSTPLRPTTAQDEAAARLQDVQLQLEEAQREKRQLLTQLDDERRRVEDAQFRYEEETIAKAELQVLAIQLTTQSNSIPVHLAM